MSRAILLAALVLLTLAQRPAAPEPGGPPVKAAPAAPSFAVQVKASAASFMTAPVASPQSPPPAPARPQSVEKFIEKSAPDALSAPEFARLVTALSEPGGYFDTDNLISNELSYLHVMSKLRQLGVSGGAYIGVGPDQNFSYIAQLRPRIAYIIDIRRDNLLQHLLFKSLFALARNRVEYLALLLGKPAPPDLRQWDKRSISELIDYLDKTPAKRELFTATRARVAEQLKACGVALSDGDLETINRIHESFFAAGLDLKFTSHNRSPRSYYPNYRELLLEKDLTGKQANYCANEDDFQFVKSLEARNLVVPVIGNLAGERALSSIGRDIAVRNLRVSAFYTSNVEFYLMLEGGFEQFVQNVKQLPRDERSVIIRSYFSGGYGYRHPQAVPGYYSSQLLQPIESLVREYARGGIRSYGELVTKDSLELR